MEKETRPLIRSRPREIPLDFLEAFEEEQFLRSEERRENLGKSRKSSKIAGDKNTSSPRANRETERASRFGVNSGSRLGIVRGVNYRGWVYGRVSC